MKYTVIRIDEDLDFGCEERSADNLVMAVVTLQDTEGNQKICKAPDAELYEHCINPGDEG